MKQRSFTWKNAIKVDGEGDDAEPLNLNERWSNLAQMCVPSPPHPMHPDPPRPIRLDELAIRYEATVRSLESQLLSMAENVANEKTRLVHHQATCILLKQEDEKRFRS